MRNYIFSLGFGATIIAALRIFESSNNVKLGVFPLLIGICACTCVHKLCEWVDER